MVGSGVGVGTGTVADTRVDAHWHLGPFASRGGIGTFWNECLFVSNQAADYFGRLPTSGMATVIDGAGNHLPLPGEVATAFVFG